MTRYQFLRTPRWIAFSVLVLVLIIVMINLALWQLRRLDERRAFNDSVRTRSAAAAQPYDTVVAPGTTIDGARPQEWKTVTATGTFDTGAQVLIRNRSLDGAPGYHVVTPLKRPDGTAILVLRGWVPLTTSSSTTPEVPPPPAGIVTVTGRVRPTQNPGALAHRDPATGVLTSLARVDIPRMQEQTPYPLAPTYVEMTASNPASPTALPTLVPLPELDDGPHLGYAVQWCIFSACAVIGWVLVVRKSAKAREQAAAKAAQAGTPPFRAGSGTSEVVKQA
ncbi:MAG TPA: SURF1 family protein [Acidimicrobiales bacterium]|nr:SURF1 family protein [Acidimicrobiales bacterium]